MSWWTSDQGVNTLKGEPAFVSADGVTFRSEAVAQRYQMVTGQPYSPWKDSDGNPPNPDNPIILDDAFILECIYSVPRSRLPSTRMLRTKTTKSRAS